MTLEKADKLIKACIDKMKEIYKRPVFDEWAVVSNADTGGLVLAYEGPRVEKVQKGFIDDLRFILSDMTSGQYQPGDFVFSRNADGANFDAFIVVGEGLFLQKSPPVRWSLLQDPPRWAA